MNTNDSYLERASYTWSEDSIRQIISPSSIAKSTYFYLQEAGYFKTQFPYFTERKNLKSFLIIYTISGKGNLEYNNTKYTLQSDDCFYINCMYHHHYYVNEGDQWEFLWIHFNAQNALGYYKIFCANEFRILHIQNKELFKNTLWRLITLNQKKNLTTEILTSNLINHLITELLIQNCTATQKNFFIPSYINEITQDIEKNFRSPLTLDYFSIHYNRNKYHIAKEFKKYIGTTINEYLINVRLSYAKELLKYSCYSINEIAFEIGMNNPSHFINLFKAREHITPLGFRKEWLN